MYHGCTIICFTNTLLKSIKVIIIVIRQAAEPWKHTLKCFPWENEETDFFKKNHANPALEMIIPQLRATASSEIVTDGVGHSGVLGWGGRGGWQPAWFLRNKFSIKESEGQTSEITLLKN